LWHQLQYLAEYHILVIQNHIYRLAYSQSDLQAARNKERKIKQLPTSIPKNIKLEILQKFIFTCNRRE
jgi:hypothetical protein